MGATSHIITIIYQVPPCAWHYALSFVPIVSFKFHNIEGMGAVITSGSPVENQAERG